MMNALGISTVYGGQQTFRIWQFARLRMAELYGLSTFFDRKCLENRRSAYKGGEISLFQQMSYPA